MLWCLSECGAVYHPPHFPELPWLHFLQAEDGYGGKSPRSFLFLTFCSHQGKSLFSSTDNCSNWDYKWQYGEISGWSRLGQFLKQSLSQQHWCFLYNAWENFKRSRSLWIKGLENKGICFYNPSQVNDLTPNLCQFALYFIEACCVWCKILLWHIVHSSKLQTFLGILYRTLNLWFTQLVPGFGDYVKNVHFITEKEGLECKN